MIYTAYFKSLRVIKIAIIENDDTTTIIVVNVTIILMY